MQESQLRRSVKSFFGGWSFDFFTSSSGVHRALFVGVLGLGILLGVLPPSVKSLLCWACSLPCFLMAFESLTQLKTSRYSVAWACLGMGLCLLPFLMRALEKGNLGIFLLIALGSGVGLLLAFLTRLTALPQLMALFHSLVGIGAMFIGWSLSGKQSLSTASIHTLFELAAGCAVGAVTFTGSVMAFLKLQGIVGKMNLSAKNFVMLALISIGGFAALSGLFFMAPSLYLLMILSLVAGWLGVLWVFPVGGADMPLVVSLLNSLSGWASVSLGFYAQFPLMIVVGAIVGFSGGLLTYVMCRGMNKSITEIFWGSFKQMTVAGDVKEALPVKTLNAADSAFFLAQAEKVLIIPGYGAAVAQAQQALQEMSHLLRSKGIQVTYGLHPVAGRMPGHMNVLLAQANVQPEEMKELEEVNREITEIDVVFIIGANDIVNPAAEDDPNSPIYRMPIFQVYKAKTILFVKRSMGKGYAGVDNPLFYNPKTYMVFGDGRKVCEEINQNLAE